MADAWQRRVDRADELARSDGPAKALLESYGRLLRIQRDGYHAIAATADNLSGRLDDDLATLHPYLARMLSAAIDVGPPRAAEQAAQLLASGGPEIRDVMADGWRGPDVPFLAKLALQPYAECLARRRVQPEILERPEIYTACPFCGHPPQLSVLRGDSASDAGGRALQCAMCATEWPWRRVLCPQCGEEDERRLGYYKTPELDHLRLDVCDSCGHYVKSVDLTRFGRAVPLVDEVAGAPLDLWAGERGYRKIVVNLVGL
jgi:FdhE protein